MLSSTKHGGRDDLRHTGAVLTRRLLAGGISLVLFAGLSVPAAAADRDGDGLRDKWEQRFGITSPAKKDSDRDGVVDSAEDFDGDKLSNLGEQRWGTNPRKKDTDGDGKPDGREDKNGNGVSNAREQDRRPVPNPLRPSLTRAKQDIPEARSRCMTSAGRSGVRKCWYGRKGSPTRVALMGDSHALMWLPAAKRAAERQGWRLITLFKGGCPPILGVTNKREYEIDTGRTCRSWRKAAFRWLEEHPVDLLMLSHSDGSTLVDGKGRPIKGTDAVDRWRTGAKRTIAAMRRPERVLLLGDVPRNRVDPANCLKKSRQDMSRCVSRMELLKTRRIERAFRQAAAQQGAQFDTLYGRICTYDPCPVVQGRVLMWRDRHHLTASFTARLAPSFRRLVEAGLAAAAPPQPASRKQVRARG
jgi:hypothetical protein